MDGLLLATIDKDENGMTYNGAVWSGTQGNGSAIAETCMGWKATNGQGKYGRSDVTSGGWTDTGSQSCLTELRLYCFEL